MGNIRYRYRLRKLQSFYLTVLVRVTCHSNALANFWRLSLTILQGMEDVKPIMLHSPTSKSEHMGLLLRRGGGFAEILR